MKKIVIVGAAVAVMVIGIVLLTRRDAASTENATVVDEHPQSETNCETVAMRGAPCRVEKGVERGTDLTRQDVAPTEEEPQTAEEKREAEEEKLVEAFDNLTDKWMKPSAKGVAMADIDNFAKSFRKIPKERRDECIHRALNLVPDENVMLLVGVLMDKSVDKEIIETVYNDILNRDEDVKKPILQEIFKDKSHPCWADTAWILDVTGELPKAK